MQTAKAVKKGCSLQKPVCKNCEIKKGWPRNGCNDVNANNGQGCIIGINIITAISCPPPLISQPFSPMQAFEGHTLFLQLSYFCMDKLTLHRNDYGYHTMYIAHEEGT